MLKFNSKWRLEPPADGIYINSHIPEEALWEFDGLIGKVATQGRRWDVLEHFKRAFCRAAGQPHHRSSSESWAETDMSSAMAAAAENAPLFLEAFYEACLELMEEELFAPDAGMINVVCNNHRLGYVLKPPELLLRDSFSATSNAPVAVAARPLTLAEKAIEVLHQSLERSEQLLGEGHHREAVQETLWVLESVTTAFRDLELPDGEAVRGKYFNEIVSELRRVERGSTLDRVLEWMTNLHGFLSSPTGGGVRHGVDLSSVVTMAPAEARLFCNLIRSYSGYLLAEHENMSSQTI